MNTEGIILMIRVVIILIMITLFVIVTLSLMIGSHESLKPFPSRRDIKRADYDKIANWIIYLPEPVNAKQRRSHNRIWRRMHDFNIKIFSMNITKRKDKPCRKCQNHF